MFGHQKRYRKQRRKAWGVEDALKHWWLFFLFPGFWPVLLIFWLIHIITEATGGDADEWFSWQPAAPPNSAPRPARRAPPSLPTLAAPVQAPKKAADPRLAVRLPSNCSACGAPTGRSIVKWHGIRAYCAYCGSKAA